MANDGERYKRRSWSAIALWAGAASWGGGGGWKSAKYDEWVVGSHGLPQLVQCHPLSCHKNPKGPSSRIVCTFGAQIATK